jgi:hypothetical protein
MPITCRTLIRAGIGGILSTQYTISIDRLVDKISFDIDRFITANEQLQTELYQIKHFSIYMVIGAIILIALILVGYYLKTQQKRKHLSRVAQQNQCLQNDKECLLNDNRCLQSDKECLQHDKECLQQDNERLQHDNEHLQYANECLCRKLVKQNELLYAMVNKPHRLTEAQWEEVGIAIDDIYNNFTERLKEVAPCLSNIDLRICYLIRLQIPVKHMATIMSIEEQSVSQHKLRLKKAITCKTGIVFSKEYPIDTWICSFF